MFFYLYNSFSNAYNWGKNISKMKVSAHKHNIIFFILVKYKKKWGCVE